MLDTKKYERINQAFRAIDRHNFVPEDLLSRANEDNALPIGYGQTISQPTTVHLMLYWLDVLPGNKVLDLGTGSGWTAAILAYLVGEAGRVFSVERIPELKQFGEKNCAYLGFDNLEFHLTENALGLEEFAPFDRILVNAAAQKEIPQLLIAQLANSGKLVLPLKSSIFEIQKNHSGQVEHQIEHYGFRFVPLIEPGSNS